jgi:hypothetical protein
VHLCTGSAAGRNNDGSCIEEIFIDSCFRHFQSSAFQRRDDQESDAFMDFFPFQDRSCDFKVTVIAVRTGTDDNLIHLYPVKRFYGDGFIHGRRYCNQRLQFCHIYGDFFLVDRIRVSSHGKRRIITDSPQRKPLFKDSVIRHDRAFGSCFYHQISDDGPLIHR